MLWGCLCDVEKINICSMQEVCNQKNMPTSVKNKNK